MTGLFKNSEDSLQKLVQMLELLPANGCYTNPCEALTNATIGQHTRHIIELYQCLLEGYGSGKVYYDNRKRNPVYENDIAAAIAEVKAILQKLPQPDKQLLICSVAGDESVNIESNYFREVLYNLEHCIHHQALIKVALLTIEDIPVDNGFGVAYSTLQYRQQCVQ